MSLTVADIFKIKEFKNACLLTGKNGINNKINNVTIMDIPKIYDWLKHGDLLITGTFFETIIDNNFIYKLKAKGVSGIITKKKFVKSISPELQSYADKIDFPIIIVSDNYSWSDVMTPIYKAIIKNQYQLLAESEQFQSALISYVLKNNSFEKMCTGICRETNLSMAISDRNFNLIDFSDDFSWKENLKKINIEKSGKAIIGYDLDNSPVWGYLYNSMLADENSSWEIIFYPLLQSSTIIGYILIKVSPDTQILNKITMLKIQSFAQIIILKDMLYKEIYKANIHYHNLVFDEILNKSQITDDERENYKLLLGRPLEQKYYICTLCLNNKKAQNKYWTVKNNNTIAELLDNYFYEPSKILVFEKRTEWIILLGESLGNPVNAIKSIINLLNNFFVPYKIIAGISKLKPLEESNIGLKEANQALKSIIENSSKKDFQFYSELGFLRLLTDKTGGLDNIFFKELLEMFIYPLKNYDNDNKTELLHTIQIYFKNNFSILKTSDELYIHKNTLRARLNRIEDIIPVDFSNNNDVLNLQISVKIYNSMQSIDYIGEK